MSRALGSSACDDVLYIRRAASADRGTIDELSLVELLKPARTLENVTIPAGSRGAVVAVWNDGAAYEVEFAEPVGSLATVSQDGLRSIEGGDDLGS